MNPKRAVKVQEIPKHDPSSYGPRLREDSREVKFRVSKTTKTRIEDQARRHGMTVSNYMAHAIRTFLDSGMAVKFIPE